MSDEKDIQNDNHSHSQMMQALNRKPKDSGSRLGEKKSIAMDFSSVEPAPESDSSPRMGNAKSEEIPTHGESEKEPVLDEIENFPMHGEKRKKAKTTGAQEIPLELIEPWGFADRPEDEFGDEDVAMEDGSTSNEWTEFVSSIKNEGVDQPVTVRKVKGKRKYELICGRRRFIASKHAKHSIIPCIIRDLDDEEAAALQERENAQRKDISSYARAMNWNRLLEAGVFDTQEQLAAKFEQKAKYVSKLVKAYTGIHPEILEAIEKKGSISVALAEFLTSMSKVTDKQPDSVVRQHIDIIKIEADKISKGGMSPNKLKGIIEKSMSIGAKKESKASTYDQSIGIINGTKMFSMRNDSNGSPTIVMRKEMRAIISEEDVARAIAELIEEKITTP